MGDGGRRPPLREGGRRAARVDGDAPAPEKSPLWELDSGGIGGYTKSMTVRTRFAPSPSGYLHRGHAASAYAAWSAAQAASGRFILRIEDIDFTRSRPRFEAGILEDLAWLGLTWEELVRRQSEHLDDYARALFELSSRGLVYRCFRTRREVLDEMARAPHGPVEIFRGSRLPPEEEDRERR